MKTFFLKPDSPTGGRISSAPMISGLSQDLFPSIGTAQAKIGLVDYQKVFIKQERSLPYRVAFMYDPAPSIVALSVCAGTDTDTVTDAQGYTAWKGCGTLLDNINSFYFLPFRVSTLTAGQGFSALDRVFIVDGDYSENIQIASITWNGNIATLTPRSSTPTRRIHSAGAIVASCLEMTAGIDMALWIKRQVLPGSPQYSINNAALRILG